MFIRYCASLSMAYIRTQLAIGGLTLNLPSQERDDLMKIAMDSIGDLFARDEHNRFHQLIRYFEPRLKFVENSGGEALSALRRLVVASTKQTLVNELRKSDPTNWKIYRNLTGVCERDSNVAMFERGNSSYYYLRKSSGETIPDDLHPEREQIPFEEGLRLLDLQSSKQLNTPKIVKLFLTNLESLDSYCFFISKSRLYNLLRRNLGMLETEIVDIVQFQAESIHNGEINEADLQNFAQHIVHFLKGEIDSRFIITDKVNQTESSAYLSIMSQYFSDLIMDGFSGKLPAYRDDTYLSKLSDEDWKLHRGRLEYLVKLGKAELKRLAVEKNLISEQLIVGSS